MENSKLKRKEERKKRRKVFNQGLKKVPKIESNSYYVSDKHSHLKYVNALDVKVDGITYRKTKEFYEDSLTHIEQFKSYIKGCEDSLTTILIEKGYNTPNVDLNVLIEDILKLKIIEPNKKYTGFKLEKDFIVGFGYDVIVEDVEIPDDVTKGYYKYLNEEIIFDEVRYQELWRN